jgi:predicted RND superfamily exporter protein
VKRFLVNISLNHPKVVVVASVIITVVFCLQIPKIHIDTDPENMLPADEEVRVFHNNVKEAFGIHDWLVLGIVREEGLFNREALSRVYRITKKIRDLDGVIDYDMIAPSEVDNIYTTDEGVLRIQTLLDRPPESEAEARRVLVSIKDNPIFKGKLASDDGTTVVVFVPLLSKEVAHEVAARIKGIIADEGGDEEYHLAGIPIAESTFGKEMFVEMAIYAPIAFILIFLLMLYFFRKPAIVLSPMIVAVMTVTWTLGLLIGLGYHVHIMSSMIPIFLIPIAVLDSIHILSEFHDRYGKHKDMRRTIIDTMDELFVPMVFTSVTTLVGFTSLTLAPIPPVQVFGAFVAFGIAVAWILSVMFNTSYAILLPKKAIENFGRSEEGHGAMRSAMHGILNLSLRYNRVIVFGGAALLIASIVGLTRIEVNDNPVKWFKADHPLRVADDVMSRHLAGTYLSYISVDGGREDALKDPEAMRYIERLQRDLEALPNVGATTSVADIVKRMRAELKGDPSEGVVPSSSDEIAQYLFLYEMSGGDPEDLFKFITPDAGRANIWVQMKKGENRAVNSVVQEEARFVRENPPPGLTVRWAGLPYINVIWQNKMVKGMGEALASSFLVVLIMMILLFRSFRMGLLSMVPLTATIALVYGFIGFVGKPYDMPIAVLSSLTLGLSIDFAIHFLQRAREAYREEGDFRAAMETVFGIPARAITRNILVIAIGFVPMFFANLVPYITVGAFFFAIMLISGFTTLFAFPAIMSLTGVGFLAGGRRPAAAAAGARSRPSRRPPRRRGDRKMDSSGRTVRAAAPVRAAGGPEGRGAGGGGGSGDEEAAEVVGARASGRGGSRGEGGGAARGGAARGSRRSGGGARRSRESGSGGTGNRGGSAAGASGGGSGGTAGANGSRDSKSSRPARRKRRNRRRRSKKGGNEHE